MCFLGRKVQLVGDIVINPTDAKQFAIVTGASSGIGFELAKQFAENGFDVLVAAEDTGIQKAAQKLQSSGSKAQAVQVDLATFDGVEKLYQAIQSAGRPVDAIAINAGVGVGGAFVDQELRAVLNLINLNVTGSVHLAKRILPDMLARGQGRVLFTASIASLMPGPFEAVYAASKAFLYSFSLALRNELRDKGITVTALMPGATETNFFHRAGMDDTKVGSSEKDDAAQVAREGFEALMAGKDHVIAGSFKNKLQGAVAPMMPNTAAEMHRNLAEPQPETANR